MSLLLLFCLFLHRSLYSTRHSHASSFLPLSHHSVDCSFPPQCNKRRHSWISLICGWFKCLIISPPRSGPNQSLYSQSNLITLTTKTIKSHCQIHLASPDRAALRWGKQPMWGLVQMQSWSALQNYVSATCHCLKTELYKSQDSLISGTVSCQKFTHLKALILLILGLFREGLL